MGGPGGSEYSVQAGESAVEVLGLVPRGEPQELEGGCGGSFGWRVEFTLTAIVIGQVVEALCVSVRATLRRQENQSVKPSQDLVKTNKAFHFLLCEC